MSKRILVAYTSATGSTAEVAEAIGEAIGAEGTAEVDVRPAGEVKHLDRYTGLVLGSSIRAGRWMPDAIEFLQNHQEMMQKMPVAYFTTCLTMVEDTEENRQTVLSYLEPVLNMAPEVQPVALGLFAGSLEPSRRMLYGDSTLYGDYRDWDAIREWATAVRPELLSGPAQPETPAVVGSVLTPGADLAYQDLSGVDLVGADLQESVLARTDLQGAGLSWAALANSDLHDADLRGANLMGTELRRADLSGANLSGAVLNGADLRDANLSGADLSQTDLNWAILRRANLGRANLRKANLGWADLRGADLSQADLAEARYNDQTSWPEGFDPQTAGCLLVSGPG